jgi:hypothetical protein
MAVELPENGQSRSASCVCSARQKASHRTFSGIVPERRASLPKPVGFPWPGPPVQVGEMTLFTKEEQPLPSPCQTVKLVLHTLHLPPLDCGSVPVVEDLVLPANDPSRWFLPCRALPSGPGFTVSSSDKSRPRHATEAVFAGDRSPWGRSPEANEVMERFVRVDTLIECREQFTCCTGSNHGRWSHRKLWRNSEASG